MSATTSTNGIHTNGGKGDDKLEAIIVHCVPRSTSTAFERAFMQRADTITFHEPTGDNFYYAKDRQCFRFKESQCAPVQDPKTPEEQEKHERYNRSLEQILRDILEAKGKSKSGKKYIFIKDMAQYLFPASTLKALHPTSRVYNPVSDEYQPSGAVPSKNAAANPLPDFTGTLPSDPRKLNITKNPTIVPTSLLRQFKHTFLVRTPEKAVPSYHKCCEEGAAGFEYFDKAEAGFMEMVLLHAWIANPDSDFWKSDGENGAALEQPTPPPLIDSATLLADPEHTVERYCEAVGVPFDKSMLSWESAKKPAAAEKSAESSSDSNGGVSEFAKWGTYHRDAEASTGFKKAESAPAPDAGRADKKKDLPKEVEEGIALNEHAYKYLLAQQTIQLPH